MLNALSCQNDIATYGVSDPCLAEHVRDSVGQIGHYHAGRPDQLEHVIRDVFVLPYVIGALAPHAGLGC